MGNIEKSIERTEGVTSDTPITIDLDGLLELTRLGASIKVAGDEAITSATEASAPEAPIAPAPEPQQPPTV